MAFTILPPNTPIIDNRGALASEWYRFFAAVQRVIGSDLVEQLQQARYVTWAAETILPNDRLLVAGTGLDLALDATNASLSLEDTSVGAGAYGAASKTVSFTVDQQGRLTAASEDDLNTDNITEGAVNLFYTDARAHAAITAGTGIDVAAGVISLEDTAVTPGSYGSATAVPVITLDQQGRATAASTAAIPALDSGLYTPTLTNETNVAASTAYECQWSRIGSVVTVSGRVDVDPTAAAQTELGISLPVASNFADTADCGGTAGASGVAGQVAGIYADATNDRARMAWVTSNTANNAMHFVFQYRII